MQTILIVDDARTDRELIGKVVSMSGHVPIYAADGEQALASARDHKPSLIFMDVVMPIKDGFSACRTLKHDPKTANIPVVLVTSKTSESDRFLGERQGADAHVSKPFSAASLMAVIQRYVR